MDHHLLSHAVIYLLSAVVLVPIFKRVGLGSVLGYLAAGSLIGPAGFGWIDDVQAILHFSELGVVFLLFLIGLELKPSRLWYLRRPILGLGGGQLLLTALVLGGVGFGLGLDGKSATVVGLGLALSSTAFALQLLSEKGQLNSVHGRSAFAVLLFQDLAVIPLLALIPMLGQNADTGSTTFEWVSASKALGGITAVVVIGRYLLRPIFRVVAATRLKEIFTATALLIVVGVSLLMESMGLSMALGAFLAGVLLADSEYRHELEADVDPFKGLLMGLFFIAVGMSVDYSLIFERLSLVMGLVGSLVLLKALVLFLIAKAAKIPNSSSRSLSVVLCQGGEFAFVLFGLASQEGLLDSTQANLLTAVVTLSMALTPILVKITELAAARDLAASKDYDTEINEENPVLIAGFGRFGQMVGRILRAQGIGYTALDHSSEHVELVRKYGTKIYFGDAARLDLLEIAGIEQAKLLVLAIDDPEASVQCAEIVRQHFPKTKIIARARNRVHAFELMDLKCDVIIRETLGSSLEAAEETLKVLGVAPSQASRAVEVFRKHDEKVLKEQFEVRHDERQMIVSAQNSMKQLESILKAESLGEESNQTQT